MSPENGRSVADILGDVDALRVKLSSLRPRANLMLMDALNTIPSAVLAVDDAGRYIGANDAACALIGYSRDELLTKSVADLTLLDGQSVQERLWNAFTRTGRQSGEYDLQRVDGSVVRVAYHAFFDVAPGIHVSFVSLA